MGNGVVRTRWAAFGAAVAVALGAGGLGISHATTSSGERPIYLPLEPCRIADLRTAPHTVGPRPAPLGADEVYTLDVWGAVGDCDLPTGTSGLALNVTAVGATEQTNLRLFPADVAVPDTANLNPTPGAPPTPNAVDVGLDDSGRFSVFNKFGSVSVIIDVVGVYDDHDHDDRYYTKEQIDDRLDGEFTCHASEFFPTSSGLAYVGSIVRSYPSGSSTSFACGVHLPVGATITEFRGILLDQDPVFGNSCSLGRGSFAASTETQIASTEATSGVSSDPQRLVTTDISQPEVLADHSYTVRCGTTDDIGIIGATVVYTYD